QFFDFSRSAGAWAAANPEEQIAPAANSNKNDFMTDPFAVKGRRADPARSMPEALDESAQHQREQRKSDAQQDDTENSRAEGHRGRRYVYEIFLELPGADEFFVL